VNKLFGLVFVRGDPLLADVVNEGLSPVQVDHHDLMTGLWWRRVSGRGHRPQDGWCVKLVDEGPTGTCARVEPNFDKLFATTLLSWMMWWKMIP
jgi:hypothetical protein